MNTTKVKIRNFLIVPLIVYIVTLYTLWVYNTDNSVTTYWHEYVKLLKFYDANDLEFTLWSYYFKDYTFCLDPSLLFFHSSSINKLIIGFPFIVHIFYLLPLAYIPTLVIYSRDTKCRVYLIVLLLFLCFYVYKAFTPPSARIDEGLLNSVRQVRLDIEWYNKCSLWDRMLESTSIRVDRSRNYIQEALDQESKHNLLVAWYFLQKAKQTGLIFEDLEAKIERIEMALIREYKIHQFYQFVEDTR